MLLLRRSLVLTRRTMSAAPRARAGNGAAAAAAAAAAAGDASPSRAAAAASEAPAVLDREAFKRTVTVPALRVPKQRCNDLMRAFRGFTLDKPKTRCIVVDAASPDTRLLLLREDLLGAVPEALPAELQAIITADALPVDQFDLQFDYRHLSADQVLKQLLPAGVEVPSSFECVGHIAHLNLKEEVLPYKRLIGQVLLDKNPHLATIVNKLGSIENEYRVFEMEVIAGKAEFETEVVQHGLKFKLDFSKVYWNSRLETEHTRLVNSFQPGEVVADIMAGIGPFAVPAGMRGCTVYANDLNPSSAQYLATNIRANRLYGRVLPFNMDGREFVRLLLATPGGPAERLPPPTPEQLQQLQQLQQAAAAVGAAAEQQQQQEGAAEEGGAEQQQGGSKKKRKQQRPKPPPAPEGPPGPPPAIPPGFAPPPGGFKFDHAVMNLPASAVEFLDAFRGAFDPAAWSNRALPTVHVYTFMRSSEGEAGVLARIEAALGGPLEASPAIHYVRDVAPNKLMLCVSFRVPAAVAFAGRGGGGEQQAKKQRVDA